MKKIIYAVLATLSGLVLLFSYRTSLDAVQPIAAVDTAGSTGTTAATTPSTSDDESSESESDDESSEGTSSSSGSASSGSTSSGTTATTASGMTDGTYTGGAANTRYGPVQVQITVSGGAIADVQVVDYPNSNREDQQINGARSRCSSPRRRRRRARRSRWSRVRPTPARATSLRCRARSIRRRAEGRASVERGDARGSRALSAGRGDHGDADQHPRPERERRARRDRRARGRGVLRTNCATSIACSRPTATTPTSAASPRRTRADRCRPARDRGRGGLPGAPRSRPPACSRRRWQGAFDPTGYVKGWAVENAARRHLAPLLADATAVGINAGGDMQLFTAPGRGLALERRHRRPPPPREGHCDTRGAQRRGRDVGVGRARRPHHRPAHR